MTRVSVVCTIDGNGAGLDDEYPFPYRKKRVKVRFGVYTSEVEAWDVDDVLIQVGPLWGIPRDARAYARRDGEVCELLRSTPVRTDEIIEFSRRY